jgi:uncharacterized membrane protein
VSDSSLVTCQVCGRQVEPGDAVPAAMLRPAILTILKSRQPDLDPERFVCREDRAQCRAQLISDTLAEERGELSSLDIEVVEKLREQETLSRNIHLEAERDRSFGERVSDRLAEWGGSWYFLGAFAAFLVLWMIGNAAWLVMRPFDPFPFILLNLILSCLAAVQAPVIMMSQHRQESRDRLRAENDYQVNLKAELEIRHLHAKLDLLLTHQWQRLLEIQDLQMDLMEEVARRSEAAANGRTPPPAP